MPEEDQDFYHQIETTDMFASFCHARRYMHVHTNEYTHLHVYNMSKIIFAKMWKAIAVIKPRLIVSFGVEDYWLSHNI